MCAESRAYLELSGRPLTQTATRMDIPIACEGWSSFRFRRRDGLLRNGRLCGFDVTVSENRRRALPLLVWRRPVVLPL